MNAKQLACALVWWTITLPALIYPEVVETIIGFRNFTNHPIKIYKSNQADPDEMIYWKNKELIAETLPGAEPKWFGSGGVRFPHVEGHCNFPEDGYILEIPLRNNPTQFIRIPIYIQVFNCLSKGGGAKIIIGKNRQIVEDQQRERSMIAGDFKITLKPELKPLQSWWNFVFVVEYK